MGGSAAASPLWDWRKRSGRLNSPSSRPFDLQRCDADAGAALEDLIGGSGLAVDADEIVGGIGSFHLLLKELRDGGAFGDFDVVREADAAIIYVEDFQRDSFRKRAKGWSMTALE